MAPNPFLSSGKPDQESEQILQAKSAALDEAVEKAYRLYTGLKEDLESLNQLFPQDLDGLEKQILLPSQIDSLLQVIISETKPEKSDDLLTSYYFSKLIQDSYGAGNNNFVLTTGERYINFLGAYIRGEEYRKLSLQIFGMVGYRCWYGAKNSEIKINGSVGKYFGENVENSKITVLGNAGDAFGYHMKNSEITIFGSVGDSCGLGALNSKIIIFGRVGTCCGLSIRNSEIILYGSVGDEIAIDANHTIFTAHTKQAYGMLREYFKDGLGNTIRLADSSGKILKEEHQ